jgi:hypothetical protein
MRNAQDLKNRRVLTVSLDDEGMDARDYLMEKGYNLSAVLREALKEKAKEIALYESVIGGGKK